MARYLQEKYNVIEHEINILPICSASKRKSECVVPTTVLLAAEQGQFTINANSLLDWFISPIKKFYGTSEYVQ